jgi:cell pole-organizing protein PopZ
MADAAENEPSMEEILSSIRRIINEDDEDAPAEAEAEAEAAPVDDEPKSQDDVDAMFDEPIADAGGDDVLELTDLVDASDEGTDPMAVDDDLMIVDREEEEPEPEPVMADPEPEIDFDALADETADGIMSEPAAAAAMGSFHTLAENIRISDEEGRTLEGVVRALLRPMLKEWLDSNLPSIVDEKIQAEIDRVARRRR